jgi:uncharacterized protein
MLYIIDGYNLIFTLSDDLSDLEDNRNNVLNILKDSFKNSEHDITVIFDGSGPDISYESFNSIKIIFTPTKMSADEYILEIISISLRPSQITVVSSDKKLTKQCSYFGSKIMNNKNFLRLLKNKPKSEEISTFQDTRKNIERLNKIFEKKFKEF